MLRMLRAPRVGAVVDLAELGEPKPTLREVIQIARRVNRAAGLTVLGQLNLLLAAAALKERLDSNGDAVWKAQELLIRTTISQSRLNQLQWKLRNSHLRDRIVFHRRQLLAAIKLVALFGDPTRGNRLESRTDHEVLPELALAINSLLDFPLPPGESLSPRELAAQLAPARELENVPRIDHALVRAMTMFGLLWKHRHHPGAANLERLFVFLTNGFDFQAYQDMTFGLFSYCRALPTNSLGAFQRQAFLNPHGAGSIVAGELFEQFLTNITVQMEDLPGEFRGCLDERRLLLDLTSFRARPVWRFSGNRYLCIDPCFVVEKLASGFYWAVNRALDTEERRYQFSSLWGLLFQDYVCEMLRHAVPPGRLIESPFYDAPREEAFDAVVLDGCDAVVLQIKSSFAIVADKYSGRFRPFFRSLSSRFGSQRGAAVRQLADNVRMTFGLPRVRHVGALPVREIRGVWPVVIFLEPIMGLGLAQGFLARRFERLVQNLIPQLYTKVHPVSFLHVEDVEVLAQHVREGDLGLVECLREKAGFDRDHCRSFHDFYFGQLLPERGLGFKRNALVGERFDALKEAALYRFKTGAYGSCFLSEFGAFFRRQCP